MSSRVSAFCRQTRAGALRSNSRSSDRCSSASSSVTSSSVIPLPQHRLDDASIQAARSIQVGVAQNAQGRHGREVQAEPNLPGARRLDGLQPRRRRYGHSGRQQHGFDSNAWDTIPVGSRSGGSFCIGATGQYMFMRVSYTQRPSPKGCCRRACSRSTTAGPWSCSSPSRHGGSSRWRPRRRGLPMTARRFASRRRSFGGNQSGVVAIEFATSCRSCSSCSSGPSSSANTSRPTTRSSRRSPWSVRWRRRCPAPRRSRTRSVSGAPPRSSRRNRARPRRGCRRRAGATFYRSRSPASSSRNATRPATRIASTTGTSLERGADPITAARFRPGAAIQADRRGDTGRDLRAWQRPVRRQHASYQPYLGGSSAFGRSRKNAHYHDSEASWFPARNATSITLSTAGARFDASLPHLSIKEVSL